MPIKKIWVNLAFIAAVFLVLIVGSAVSAVAEDQLYSGQEARHLSQFTAASLDTLLDGSWFQSVEDYSKDQFYHREQCMAAYYSFLDLLQVNERNGYVRGKNNQIMNVRPFDISPQQIESANHYGDSQISAMTKIASVAQEYGGKVIYMNVPYRMEFNAEMYPKYYESGKELDDAMRASIIQKAKQAGITVVETYELLRAHEEEYIFFATDHHWTIRGAYYAYQELLNSINQNDPALNLRFPDFNDLNVTVRNERMVGSYLRVWGDSRRISNDYMEYAIPYDMPGYTRYENGERSELPVLDTSVNNYSAFMYGDYANTRIETNRPELPSILYVSFSYANPLELLSIYNFNTVESLDPRKFTGSICTHVQATQPDYIVIVKDDIYEGNYEFSCTVE